MLFGETINCLLYLSFAFRFDQVSAGKGWSWKSPKNEYERTGEFVGTAPSCSATSNDCAGRGLNFWYSVTSGNGHYCSSGRKVYCNRYPSPYDNIAWKGTATFCQGGCGDCSSSMTCVATDGSGDGVSCSCSLFCTNEKAMCVSYRSDGTRRLQNEDLEDALSKNFSDVVSVFRKGVNIGFYLYLGDEFEDDEFLETNKDSLKGDFVSAVATALSALVLNVETTGKSGIILNADYASRITQFDHNYAPLFMNASLIVFGNIGFVYETDEAASEIESFLQTEANKEPFETAIQTALEDTSFKDLDIEIDVYFVEANAYITGMEAFCDIVDEYADNAFKVSQSYVFIIQLIIILFSSHLPIL